MSKKKRPDEIFLGEIKLSPSRVSLVYRGTHHGRDYIRMRVWNRHKTKGVWYPCRYRSFVFPAEHADEMGETLLAGARSIGTEKPDWLIEREAAEDADAA